MRGGPRRFPQNSSCSAVLRCRLNFRSAFRVRGCHPLWPGFPACSAMLHIGYRRRSYNPGRCHRTTPVWAGARSLATTCAIVLYFLFLWVLRCFSSPRSPRATPGDGIAPAGFPHSDIRGSSGICPSPRLFAAYHVLRRLREPQASPVRPCSLSLCLDFPPLDSRNFAREHPRRPRPPGGRPFAYIRLARFSF